MHQLTKQKINDLLAKTGHELTVADLDDVEALDRLAAKITNTTRSESRLLSEPFELCGVLFYPLTVAKSLWFAEKCEEWEVEGTAQEALLFWLLTVPNVTGELDAYSRKKDADKAVKRLSRKLHCSAEEMSEVYVKCVGVSMTGEGGEVQYGGLVECLLREYGGDPDRWLYETPLPIIETLMNNLAARVNAEMDAARQTSSRGGRAVAPVASERLRALKNFREKANEIGEKWNGA